MSSESQRDGWKIWLGGDIAPYKEKVEVKYRAGATEKGYASAFRWNHKNSPVDIVAWRFAAEEVNPAETDPYGKSPHESGAKLDQGKVKAGVLHDFSEALFQVAQVGTYGAEKYTRGGWQSVPNGAERYFDAFWRHLLESRYQECDDDTGLSHLAHAAWNLLAVIELEYGKQA